MYCVLKFVILQFVSNEFSYVILDKFMWFKKKGMGSVPAPRSSHAATLMGEKWLIFGGRIIFI